MPICPARASRVHALWAAPDVYHESGNVKVGSTLLEEVAVTVVLVDDQPRRDVGRAAVTVVHDVHDVAVRGRFVDERAPSWSALHARHRRRWSSAAAARRRAAAWPPCVVHQVERRAGPLTRLDAVAGVLLGADRPLGADGLSLVLVSVICPRCARSRLIRRSPCAGRHQALVPFLVTTAPAAVPFSRYRSEWAFSHTGNLGHEQPGPQTGRQRLAHGEGLLAEQGRLGAAGQGGGGDGGTSRADRGEREPLCSRQRRRPCRSVRSCTTGSDGRVRHRGCRLVELVGFDGAAAWVQSAGSSAVAVPLHPAETSGRSLP